MSTLDWSRPLGLSALALPVALLLLSRLRARPLSIPIATLALWREVAAHVDASAGKRRTGLTLRLLFVLAALVLGALALAGPRTPDATPRREWTIVLDRSPSMFLPLASDRPRVEAAAEAARDHVLGAAGARDRVRWIAAERDAVDLPIDALPPDDWFRRDAWDAPAPRFELHDRPGVVWATDVAPGERPREAALVATGATPVGGPVGSVVGASDTRTAPGAPASAARLVVWTPGGANGGRLERGEVVPPRTVLLDGDAPDVLRDLLELWARERGLAVRYQRVQSEALALRVAFPNRVPGDGRSVAVGARGRGWALSGRAVPGAVDPSPPWLVGRAGDGGEELALVTADRGTVRIALAELDEPRGDPAAFAVAWSELFDASVLPVPGVVPLAERMVAGEAARVPGVRPTSVEEDDAPRERFDALLAGVATLCAVIALSSSVGRSS